MTHGHLQPKPFKAAQREEAPAGTSRNTFSFANMSVVQPKLTIGEPDNEFEKEADHVASEVVQRINGGQDDLQRSANEEEEEDKVQRSPISSLMRKSARHSGGIVSGAATDEFESQLNQSRGGGSPLEPKLRGQLESAMDADFSQVRIHTGSQSDQLNRSIQAKAFTTGQDVFFKQGEYNPGSRSGQELITHELTHVVQQTGGGIQRKAAVIQREVGLADASAVMTDTKSETIKRRSYILEQGLDIFFVNSAYKALVELGEKCVFDEHVKFVREYYGQSSAQQLYDTYIADPFGPMGINISGGVRKKINNIGRDNLKLGDLKAAMNEAIERVRKGLYDNIDQSGAPQLYMNLADALGYESQ